MDQVSSIEGKENKSRAVNWNLRIAGDDMNQKRI